jgi:SAM-dependent methyltransferase
VSLPDEEAVPPAHPRTTYWAELGDTLGEAYLRYSHTMGTTQEIDFLLELLDLPAGARVLDVGCGPGRHAVALAEAGLAVTGIDVSARFLEVAAERARRAGVGAAFFEVDARQMPFDDEFDAVISICQGGFGLMGPDDPLVLKRMAESARRGGRIVATAFNAYFEIRSDRRGTMLDADSGIVHERSVVKDPEGADHVVEMWNSIYTPRELRLLAVGVGLVPESVWSVEPGEFARRPPDADHPELMLAARKP